MERRTPADTQSNAYELFILVLTVYSLLLIMVALVLPDISASTRQLLGVYDNGICLVFLGDFTPGWSGSVEADPLLRRAGGWTCSARSPASGSSASPYFRLARLSRLARITRLFRGQRKNEIVRDIVSNRGQYAGFVTFLTAFLVLSISSVLVLQPREQLTGRQHHHRWRLAVVVGGHPHHRRQWRLPGRSRGRRADRGLRRDACWWASASSHVARQHPGADHGSDRRRPRGRGTPRSRGSSRSSAGGRCRCARELGPPADQEGA